MRDCVGFKVVRWGVVTADITCLVLLAIHEGGGVKRKVHSTVDNVDCRDEEDDDGGDLAPQLLLRYQDGEGDDIDHTAHHSHCTQEEIIFSRKTFLVSIKTGFCF